MPMPSQSARWIALALWTTLWLLVPTAAPAQSTADHSQYEILQQPFASGPEVTKACLSCHTNAAQQIHGTIHWTWEYEHPLTEQTLGKRHVINSFCMGTASNWPRCTSCHTGYGWEDDSFDFSAEDKVDCLVCHDGTGTYRKFPNMAGRVNTEPKRWPPGHGPVWEPPDLTRIAQSVEAPGRKQCGDCHYYGGGGDGVKHGHLDSSLNDAPRSVDVHMSPDGGDFTCQTCHTAGSHQIAGSRYFTKPSDARGVVVPGQPDQTRGTCQSCHGTEPHDGPRGRRLNAHGDTLACTTCHVPTFARGGRKTVTWWDWSTAGRVDDDGKPLIIEDAEGYPRYHYKKGTQHWEADVVPSYRWYSGEIRYTLLGHRIDPSRVVPINRLSGDRTDPQARIWPFKIMRGRQPYDAEHNILGLPHLYGDDPDAFWKNFDWDKALRAGLLARNVEYSGQHDFVETEFYWPVTHMVAPAEESLSCDACHAPQGRLSGVPGVYIAGQTPERLTDRLGWTLVLVSLGAVALHGSARIVARVLRRLGWLKSGS